MHVLFSSQLELYLSFPPVWWYSAKPRSWRWCEWIQWRSWSSASIWLGNTCLSCRKNPEIRFTLMEHQYEIHSGPLPSMSTVKNHRYFSTTLVGYMSGMYSIQLICLNNYYHVTNCVHIYILYIYNYCMRTSERSKYRVTICFSTRNVIIMYLIEGHNVFGI